MRGVGLRGVVLASALLTACSGTTTARPFRRDAGDFFPLTPRSSWEYAVTRRAGAERFRFTATVKQDDFVGEDGRACRVVDERYTDVSLNQRFPVLYCQEGGFLHRVMSLEYQGDTLRDNGMRSGELKFLPTDLENDHAWEGITTAYNLPDGSGFVVEQSHRASEVDEPVVVPAGSFDGCRRVDTTAVHHATGPDGAPVGPTVTYFYADWYAPGVGLVKAEQRATDQRLLATIELLSFDIGGRQAGAR